MSQLYFEAKGESLLERIGMSKSEFARRMGIRKQNVKALFKSKNLETIYRAAAVMGVPFEMLISYIEEPDLIPFDAILIEDSATNDDVLISEEDIPTGNTTEDRRRRHDPFNWGLDECIFISKILSIEEYRSRYRDYLKAIAAPGSEFTYEKSIVRIREWQDLIRPYLANATGEDQAIQDLPASWSNNRWYRIMEDGSNNWFRIKCSVLSAL